MSRDYSVKKTRDGKPKVVLYQDGAKVIETRVASPLAGRRLGAAWIASSPID